MEVYFNSKNHFELLPTFEDIANAYDVAVSTVFDATSLVEKTLSAKFTLPKREELTKNPVVAQNDFLS